MTLPRTLRFPHPQKPAFESVVEIAPGVFWLRMALPFALDHINLYLFEDGPGWALFDTGIGTRPSIEAWERVLGAEPLGGKPITRLLVSHFHADHIGLAGWFHDRYGMPLHATQTEYLLSKALSLSDKETRNEQAAFYRSTGLSENRIGEILDSGHSYFTLMTRLPPSFERIKAGDDIVLGGRTWRVLTGGGHASEQAMLWCERDRLFFAADQVLAHISPNVSVFAMQPLANPLSEYLASLAQIQATVSDDVLVLPCHNLPFHGLHDRTRDLTGHHAHRCELIADACKSESLTCEQILPIMFHRALDPQQMSFAIGEALAHLNHMVVAGELSAASDVDGVLRYRRL
jgi:glyoxylase-like metal-dependent hydrolase (beta-lactamase superfamily II)